MRHFRSILGVTSMLEVVPMVSGPLVAGRVFAAHGNCDIGLVIMPVATAGGTGAVTAGG